MPTTRPFPSPTPLAANPATLLPLGAMLLAGSFSAVAQDTGTEAVKTLKPVTITEKAEEAQGKDSVRATTTSIGKGKQELRDIPQSITVVTEKLVDDRNLDTLKDVLHNTAGVTFLAAEGGEEDIRLRGFSLAQTGDIFVDGMRDPAFYDRDTFNSDKIELLRGSASMLFGRGSTGGAVNQSSKQGRAIDDHEISTTVGMYNYRRVTGDFNIQTGEDSGLRINAMVTKADNNAAGSSIDKRGIAANYRWGIGTKDEFSVGLMSLDNDNGINYGVRWIRPTSATATTSSVLNSAIAPQTYYGMASDYNKGTADYITASHTHRFDDDSELKTSVRRGVYTRDQRATLWNYATGTGINNFTDATVLTRGAQNKIQDLNSVYLQTDYTKKFSAFGVKHELFTGVDFGQENKNVFRATGGVSRPATTVGTPNDGASVDESARIVTRSGAFQADNLGLYAMDLVQVAEHWKVLGGLRFDRMRGNYITEDAAGVKTAAFEQNIANWSQRVGVMYQPTELSSFHFSWGTSFNTSGDTYSYSAGNSNAKPEQSRNVEIGAKLDSADKRYTTRLAIFQSVKFNERNTDPDNAAATPVLSGQRHATGLEIDASGMLTPKWEIYGSYMWMPDAMVDAAAPCPATGTCSQNTAGDRVGDRPSLTPVHSGTVWTTYQFTPQFRAGTGVNFRSEQSPNRNPGFFAPGYATLDLMGEYKFNEKAVLKVNLTNALDKLYADGLYTSFYTPGPGRNLQATLNLKF
ncbi:TonB-dependent receptor [Rhodoferax sp. TBRC 17198]|uniref:TonB-dependent receptor n=1 Tax=Rhodoferax potami TaxID=3068338 RepID=UPI0028BDDF06|nr:TonB-dependent receptor [Rhodoferax sp. TBRC 17198]MDT7521749.1 TonB-dependent receptor [Rhodoferax sp. TBRC 17198]